MLRDVEELRTMLDVDGDGQITYDELVTTIQEAYAARCAGGLQAAADAFALDMS